MTVSWITAFLDLPAPAFDASVAFWRAATGSSISASRGERGEFATLLPSTGDAHLRVQRTEDGPPGVHLDLHTDDVRGLAAHAVQLGAQIVEDRGYVVLRSPAGLTWCAVPHHGESRRSVAVRSAGGASLLDQVCIDVPHERFEAECAFWSAVTGWALLAGSRPEFAAIERPDAMPIRFLLQRLRPDDAGTAARAHPDLACGADVDGLVAEHVSLGAVRLARPEGAPWQPMRDPSGLVYCLTPRPPLMPAAGA